MIVFEGGKSSMKSMLTNPSLPESCNCSHEKCDHHKRFVTDQTEKIATLNTNVTVVKSLTDDDSKQENNVSSSDNNIKHDNSRSFIPQQSYFTYQRKGNQELQIQALNIIVADLQTQLNNLSPNNPPPDDSGIGTA